MTKQQEQLVETARRGAMLLRIAAQARIDPAFVVLVQNPEANIRLIASVATLAAASDALGIELGREQERGTHCSL